MATVIPPSPILWLLSLLASMLLSVSGASNFSLVVSGPTVLQLSPSVIVENSPGLKPGAKVKCERVEVHGLSRVKNLRKFANSLKVKVSRLEPSGRSPLIEVCFHRNVSSEVGTCPQNKWERLTKEPWVKTMSPFDYKILDIRIGASYSERLEVSIDEEFFLYRILFLVFGIVLISLASLLSKSLVFYYSSTMVVGVFLVILMVLFQGMKLLPTGRKSSLAIFLYSCFVGMGSFLLRYVPRLFRLLMVEFGLPEDMYDHLAIFLLVFLVIAGAWLGFMVVHKLVLTEDGTVDHGVSQFVTWSIRIVASVMILQSSADPLLAVAALVCGTVFSFVAHTKAVRRFYKRLCRLNMINFREPLDPLKPPVSPRTPTRQRLSDSGTFYSTFHETPERRKYSKEEWELFTKESTRNALEGLVSSPDFNRWALAHADRITLAPKNESHHRQKRWFHWF